MRQRSSLLQLQMALSLVLTLTLVLALVRNISFFSKVRVLVLNQPIIVDVVVVVVVVVDRQIRNFWSGNLKFSKKMGRIWDGLGMLWGWSGNIFERISDRL